MKKLLIFLMIAIPLVVILVVNLTVSAVAGMVSISVDSISLNLTEISATIDEVVKLEATVLPKNATNKEVKWESTNDEVAKVDLNGNVSFVGFGSGYITAITEDGHKIATCYFYATDTKIHQIKIFSKDSQEGNYYVGVGKTISLESEILPMEAINKYVEYTSEDESIATVDSNGLVTGKKLGRVKISSTSEDNRNISDSIVVEVVNPVERIIVNSRSVLTSTNTYQLAYKVYPSDASVSRVNYESSDPEIATVSETGLVTFTKPGKVKIILTSVEGGKTEEIEVECTSGYARDLVIENNMISASINDGGIDILYSTIPQRVDVDVEFSSDDEEVAYVDDSGYVQFMGGGSTFIRARIKKSESEYIEKVVGVYVESPATKILIEDEFTVATKTFKLNPASYPENSTNKKYFFVSKDIEKAVVDENGVVTFVNNEIGSVEIEIFANEQKNVHKTVTINYTNGYPTDLSLEKNSYNLNYGETRKIDYNLIPENTSLQKADLKIEIKEQHQNGGGNSVIELVSEDEIKAVGGGRAIVEISYTNANAERVVKEIEVTVRRFVEDVLFETDLELYNEEYYTCEQTVEFNISSITLDATNKNLTWSINSFVAIKSGVNEIKFNNSGTAEIIVESEDLNFKKTFIIRYIKSNLIDATIKDFAKTIEVGQEVEIEIDSLFPSNGIHGMSLKASNQITSSELGKVIEIVERNKFKAVAGGKASLTVSVSNLKFNYSISVIRKAENIIVEQEGIKTTNQRVLLRAEVLPVDTTDTSVSFESLTEDVAEIDGDYVVFKKDGIARIKVRSLDGGFEKEFNIEKIAKGTGEITTTGEPIEMLVGDSNIINLSNIDFDYDEDSVEYRLIEEPIEEGLNVVNFVESEQKIEAVNIGKATLNVILNNSQGIEKIVSFEFIVRKISESVEFDTSLQLLQRDYITAQKEVDLSFNLLPETTTNKNYTTKISDFVPSVTNEDVIAPVIEDGKLVFTTPGTAVIDVNAVDGGASRKFRIRYTGGVAVDAVLNIDQRLNENGELVLEVGEKVAIQITEWLPQNITNKTLKVKEDSHSQGVLKVVEISGNEITAVAGGWSNVVVEITGSVTKIIKISVTTNVSEISIDNFILTSQKTITLKPVVGPVNATNKTLDYKFSNGTTENTIATIIGSTITFNQAGEVEVVISATDEGKFTKTIRVRSTLGYVDNFALNFIEKNIKKEQEAKINVVSYYPSDVTNKTFKYELISNQTSDGTDNAVVELKDNGIVVGKYRGTAIIRVYTENYYQEKVYVDCVINVYTPIEEITVKFFDCEDENRPEKDLQIVNGDFYTTAQSDLGYMVIVGPSDADRRNVLVESSNESIAVVFEERIRFKREGSVVITFRENSDDLNAVFVQKKILYTKSLLNAEIDQSDFVNKNMSLDADQTYQFKVNSCNPLDIDKLIFTIENVEEQRIDQSKAVYEFNEDGTFKALGGGSVSFNLKVNGFNVGRYNFEVLRKSDEIKVDKTEVYIKGETHKINAVALPSDSYQKELKYEIVDANSKATVDQYGEVSLNGETYVLVRIRVVGNDAVEPMLVSIIYSNSIQKLNLLCSKDPRMLFFGDSADVVVSPEPFGVDDFEFDFYASDPDMVSLRLLSDGYRIRVTAKEKAGDVDVIVKVRGKDISEKIFFKIEPGVSAIELELDKNQDGNGQIGGYRVWGDRFVDNQGKLVNTYKMNVPVIKPDGVDKDQVKKNWITSNPEVATVDENGIVTFLKDGIVTISVEPEKQVRGYKVRDSYTFEVVKGINVFSFDDFIKAVKVNDDKYVVLDSIVLQTNLKINKKLLLNNNLYGNGFDVDFTDSGEYDKILIENHNILIDNVNIFADIPKGDLRYLSQLDNAGRAILVSGGDYLKNIVIRNTKVEYAFIGIEVASADLTVAGCIIKNTLSSGLIVNRNSDRAYATNVVVRDCVFGNSLFGSILFTPEQNPENVNYRSTITFEGKVYIFNWLNLEEFTYDNEHIRNFVPDVSEQIQAIVGSKEYDQFIYTDPQTNKRYIMLGIISSLRIELLVASVSVDNLFPKYDTYGDVYYGGQKNPQNLSSYGKVNVVGSIKVGVNGVKVGTADCNLNIYTQNNLQDGSVKTVDIDVTPEKIRSQRYYDDGEMYKKIRQSH